MTLKDNRREYDYGKLSRDSLNTCPFEQFDAWMQQALDANICRSYSHVSRNG
jgi:pyridoxamine 5'-phosphate oxidase